MSAIEKSVVQIFNTRSRRYFYRPWNFTLKEHSSGTGFCINIKNFTKDKYKSTSNKNKFILTNAHCVNSSLYLTIQKIGLAHHYKAVVNAISYECDLAIISIVPTHNTEPIDIQLINNFWDSLEPLKFTEIPDKLEKVFVYGYPLGGRNVSITKGIVNRIIMHEYSFGKVNLFSIQIDAPINPGNSGGPALNKDGKIIGIAFSGIDMKYIQNFGMIIPSIIIKFFINTIVKYKSFSSLCDLGISTQNMNNSIMQQYYDLPPNLSGKLITEVDPNSSSNKLLLPNDILLKINDINITNDGNIPLSDIIKDLSTKKSIKHVQNMDELVDFNTMIGLKMKNEIIKVQVLRNKKVKNVQIKLKQQLFLIPILEYQINPSYYIIGGLILIPLSEMALIEKYNVGEDIEHLLNIDYELTDPNDQVILLSEIISTDMTIDYIFENQIISHINDIYIHNMQQLKSTISKELNNEYIKITFKFISNIIIFKSSDIKKYNNKLILDSIGDIPEYII